MTVSLLLVAAGAAVLAYAGNKLVDFAAAIAEKARLTPAVIGLTIVAAGTSTPELFVSLTATLRGSPAIAVGNVVGSNIANIGFVLGLAALITPIPLTQRVLKFEYPFMILATWIALLLFRDLLFDRLEAGFFVGSMMAFTAYSVWVARQEATERDKELLAELVPAKAAVLERKPSSLLALGTVASLAGLTLGARLLVTGAIGVAQGLGLSERVIGLTVVAIGTSLPELVASTAAALKRHHEMAVTNIVGSNIFNLLFILGATGLVRPVPIDVGMVSFDMWVMMGFAVGLIPLLAWDRTLSRIDGAVLMTLYAGYLAWLIIG